MKHRESFFAAAGYDNIANQALARRRGIIEGNESIADCLHRVHSSIVAVDKRLEGYDDESFAEELAAAFVDRTALPGTPILSSAGRNRSTVAACTVVRVPVRAGGTIRTELLWERSKAALGEGVGTGYDLSETLDPLMELERLNDWLLDFDQELVQQNRRPVAARVTLDARHADIRSFIRAKESADFTRWRANISVAFRGDAVDDIFDSLIYPIAESAHRCGEPGVLFFDRFEADNPTPHIRYDSTAPCAEVALAAGELCTFWYTNLEAMVVEANNCSALDWDRLRRTVGVVVRALDAAVQMSVDPGAAPVVAAKRRIGVGVTGFHAALIRLGIPYASTEAEQLAARLSEFITFCAHEASAKLAQRRGAFPAFHMSRFRDLPWLQRKAAHRTGVISAKEWGELHRNIGKTGIRHASVVAYPPTGMSSELLGTSKSYEPFFMLTGESQPDRLTGRNIRTIPLAVEHGLARLDHDAAKRARCLLLDSSSQGSLHVPGEDVLATARQISVDWHLRIHAAFQRFADESGAKTVNVANDADLDTTIGLFQSARQLGLKGITVFRDGCLDNCFAAPTVGSEFT